MQHTARHDSPSVPSSATPLLRSILRPGLVIMLGLVSLGAPLVVLPIQIDIVLGFGPIVAGAVLAAEALVTLMTRPWVGRLADRHGPRQASILGLIAAAASGLFYLLAAALPLSAISVLMVILVGRAAMGIGQGFLFSGGTAWAVGLAGFDQAGRAISWIGIAMFAGIAAGTALGGASTAVATHLGHWLDGAAHAGLNGFVVAAVITMLAPLTGLVIALFTPASPVVKDDATPASLTTILRAIWRPSLGFGLAATGYSALTSFVVLAFVARGWDGGDIALLAFVASFVAARIILGDVSDRAQGPAPILVALAVQAAGLLMLWLAGNSWIAIAAAALSGFGVSLTYPLLAMPAIRAVPRKQTASAIGLYDGSYDIASLITPPICGVIAATAGYQAIFLVAGLMVLLGMFPAHAAWRTPKPGAMCAETS